MSQSRSGLLFDLFLNGVAPWLGYLYLVHIGWSDFRALLAVTVIPGLVVMVGLLSRRRLDPVAGVALAVIGISLALAALSQDSRLLQLRESYLTGLFGLLFIFSSWWGKPVLFWLVQANARPEHRPLLEQRKPLFSTLTWVWGASFLLEFGLKVWMVENFEIATVLALGPVLFYGLTAVMAGWSFWYVRRQALPSGQGASSPEVPNRSE